MIVQVLGFSAIVILVFGGLVAAVVKFTLTGKAETKLSERVNMEKYKVFLGSDIAKKLNTVGYLTELTRTNIGDFSVLEAKKVKEVNETDSLPIYKMLSFLQTKVVSLEMEKDIRNGKKLSLEGDDIILLVNKNNEALAIYEKKDDFYYCKRGLFDANN